MFTARAPLPTSFPPKHHHHRASTNQVSFYGCSQLAQYKHLVTCAAKEGFDTTATSSYPPFSASVAVSSSSDDYEQGFLPSDDGEDRFAAAMIRRLMSEFDSELPIEQAVTPPSSWYTYPKLLPQEMQRIFWKGWQVVGRVEQVEKPFYYFSGSLGKVQYLVCRDGQGELHAFHNVCRHHAASVASGCGQKTCFVCPYHGWTYSLDGKLQKATRLSGIQKFEAHENGLIPIKVAVWGPFVLLNIAANDTEAQPTGDTKVGHEWLGDALPLLERADLENLCHIVRREYIVNCNWKVFCDNYLDGGYHVPFAHKSLAKGLSLDSYYTKIFERVSVQMCTTGDTSQRLGSTALYAFVYPNFMINRYGPWMDTNLVLPITTSQCLVVFDYFLDPAQVGQTKFIEESLHESELVQVEDTALCEGVQRGLESPAFSKGRYAPQVETAMHHFHCLLKRDFLPPLVA